MYEKPLNQADVEKEVAIHASGVTKIYKLFPSAADQFMNLIGIDAWRFWRRKHYPEFQALNNVDLTIRHGERVGIVGCNGAGKTTLLKLISGTIQPTRGLLQVEGRVQALMKVGVGFHPEFTGLENIRGSLLYSGLTEDERVQAEEEIVDFCELGDFLNQPLKTYSMGMQSRLQFACATVLKPEILIIDEILGAGDAYFSIKSSERMKRLTNSGCTLVIVSHSMQQILQFCERAIWLDKGKIRGDGAVRDIVGEYEVFMRTMAKEKLGVTEESDREDMKTGPAFILGEEDFKAQQLSDNGPVKTISNCKYLDEDDSTVTRDLSEAEVKGFGKENCLRSRLSDGQAVFRWPSEHGVKLDSLRIYHCGQWVTKFQEKEPIEFRIQTRSERDGEIACIYQLTIFTLDNRRITRMKSPVDKYTAKTNALRSISLRLAPCLLGAGHYYVNFAILPIEDRDTGVPNRRYDLVTRFGDFEVFNVLDYRESIIFFHRAEWKMP